MNEIKSINKNMSEAYSALLLFLDNQDNFEENFTNLMKNLQEHEIITNPYKIKQFLHIISAITLYHFRSLNFFSKIDLIITNIREQINNHVTNDQLFSIFNNNKRMLLFLFEDKIIQMNRNIAIRLSKTFPEYFYIELKDILIDFELKNPIIDSQTDFLNKRKEGENDNKLCQIIRDDALEIFAEYINDKICSINDKIDHSIYETNKFLENQNIEPTLIEYAAFYGSIRIFTNLYYNNAKYRPLTIILAIHGGNKEIIQLLLNKLPIRKNFYKLCFNEALRFHQNDIADFFHTKYLTLTKDEIYDSLYISLDVYNYRSICKEFVFEDQNKFEMFWHFCAADYYENAKICLSNSYIDVNRENNGTSALGIASSKGNTDIVKLLLAEDNIDVNLVNDDGNTVIHCATSSGNIEIAGLLSKHSNIDLNCKTVNEHLTPLMISLLAGYNDIAKIFLENTKIDVNCISEDRLTPLLIATSKQNKEIISLLLNHDDINTNCRDKNNQTPLYIAVYSGKLDLVKSFLVFKNIEINAKVKNNGYTPLLLSVSYNYENIAELLLQNESINVNCKNDQGWTPLMIAACNGFYKIVKLLLASPFIDINCQNNNGMTALMIASINGHSQIVKALLDRHDIKTNIISNEKNTALFYAVRNSNADVILEFINHKQFVVNCIGALRFTLLTMAICKKNSEIVKMLLTFDDLDVNAPWSYKQFNYSPLFLAVVVKSPEIIRLLLVRNDTNVNFLDNNLITPLFCAAQSGFSQGVDLLLSRDDIDVNCRCGKNRWTPLMVAITFHHIDIIKLLLEYPDTNLNYQSSNGSLSPIILAVLNGDSDILSLVVSHSKVDVNAVDKLGSTSLHFASFLNNPKNIEILLTRHDIQVNLHNNEGLTPIGVAAKFGNSEALICLMNDQRVDVNLYETKQYNSPLHIAVSHGNSRIVQLLISNDKVDVNIKNQIGVTPLYQAVLKHKNEIVEQLILNNLVDINIQNTSHLNTALHEAAFIGDYQLANILLTRSDINVNIKNGTNRTPLFVAVEHFHKELVQVLLDKRDLDVNCRCGKNNDTPLHAAVKANDSQMVKLLLTHKNIGLDYKNGNGQTPITLAAHSPIILQMLQNKMKS